jgi:hypothetical protein
MRCNVCDAVNREENKFCGMCGARVQGVSSAAAINRKCISCGKVNEPDYQYCAMCGMRLERSGNVARTHGVETHGVETRGVETRGIETRGAETRGIQKKQASAKADVLLPTGTGGPEKRGTLEPLALAEPVGLASPPPSSRATSPGARSPSYRNAPPRRSGSAGASTSLLGLNDAPGDVSYLLREDRQSRHVLRKLVLLAVLAGVSTIAYSRWRPLYDENPGIVKQTEVTIVDAVRGWVRRQEKPRPSVKVDGSRSMKADESQDDVNKQKDGSQAAGGAGEAEKR